MRFWPGLGGLGPPRAAAFLGLCYLYVWLRIQPHLIFHVQEPVFFRGGTFLHDFLQIPGGASAYAAAFAGQSYTIGWLGALLLTLVAGAIGWCVRDYVRTVTGRQLDLAMYVPVVLLLVLHNRYHYDLAFDLSLLAVVAAAATTVRLTQKPWGRCLVVLAAAPILYWTVGGAWLLFALLGAIGTAVAGGTLAALACLATGAVVPWLATLTVYPGTLSDAYLHLLPISGPYLLGEPRLIAVATLLYLFTPLLTLAVVWLPSPRELAGMARVGLGVGLAVLGGLLVYGTFDANHRTMLEIDHQARARNWDGVLDGVGDLHAYDVLTVYNIQRALCYSGRLSTELFAFPHLHSRSIFVPSPEAPSRFLTLADNLLELGYVNKAEHMLQEALEIHGDRPTILRRLVTVNVLKDRPGAARVYLGLLARSPLDRAWAQQYLADLAVDPQRQDESELARLRGMMVQVDYPGFFSTEDILRQLLERNPANMLAFDLLMGHYLQTARPDKIVQNLKRLDQFPEAFPGGQMPRLFEEAVMMWATQVRSQTGTMPTLPLHGRELSTATQTRYAEFSQVLAAHRGNVEGARQALGERHGDTFWYYYLYRNPDGGVPITSRASRPAQ